MADGKMPFRVQTALPANGFLSFYDGKKMPPAVWRRLPKEY
ncbi:hypothetical protein NEILACOT_05273 [Neisseria lactamica ATCC 23970]|uniref:Uncharacterized protein n=1 Tax=Neisseria lactamica ATCC 23970 TaxID=546265 RepID=D0WCJ1_NEILA|nr:hypothetical protein NEILACOT_05273 [Neisseria lactamica ATCC 23970]